ncbi:TetR family transcriptional regulator [Thermosporothrix hazakensis]|jgi:AcrR family transcriptional regulator|uniref:TetR family transcriptional regulator n=2 Tax=Thermosporothrix TaxID=768650 RepID=A0A326U497_THEHA|nr:TetR/AcrR family transcriptional regulator [Thermosporothrix hazakensis]PZW27454.1 TetR family transcriptional regulator [Thermosporothrix hazakensis]BBH85954.1 hypothetical protein KTC_07050 [Thermosporothrix sp. COM3]GCE45620.1 hypothetical protein KTH_04890 [Thermosporothrix hazakensis]
MQDKKEHIVEQDSFRQLAASLFEDQDFPRIPQQARSREKRRELLKAAVPLFIEKGYIGTTADEIAQAAGVSVGTFYSYFRNKRQVLIAIFLEQLEEIFSHIRLIDMDFSLDDYRATIRTAVSAALLQANMRLRQVWHELVTQDQSLEPYQRLIREYILQELEKKIQVAVERGRTWPDLDIEATALVLLSLFDTMSIVVPSEVGTERLIDAITDMIYRTLFPPKELAR